MRKFITAILITIPIIYIITLQTIHAFALSITYTNKQSNITVGDIVSTSSNNNIVKTDISNSYNTLGVVTSTNGGITVTNTGIHEVYVSNQNGNISKGDEISPSQIPGVGMLDNTQNISIGDALSSFSKNSKGAIKEDGFYIEKILVAVNIHYQANNAGAASLNGILYSIGAPLIGRPITVTQFILITLITLGTFVFAGISFIKSSINAIALTGRTPLSKDKIVKKFLKQTGLSALLIISAIVISYIIIIFF